MSAWDDNTWVVLRRVSFTDGPSVLPGSSLLRTNCGHTGWAAAETVEYLGTPEGAAAYLLCTSCLPEGEAELSAVPGAFANIEAMIGTAAAERVRAEFERIGVHFPD